MFQPFPLTTELPDALVDPVQATPLPPADALAIREAVTRIYLAEDSRNAAALRHLVTTDFVQEHSLYGHIEGGRAFADWVLEHPTAFDRYRHVALNTVTRSTGTDSGEALSYVLVIEAHPDEEPTAAVLPRILATGVVRDRFVREEGRWRIAHRIYDQFAVTAAVLADRRTRLDASAPLHSSSTTADA
ncbi:MAG: nuclear transport factor 2 family protein [Myxococcota bacterium]